MKIEEKCINTIRCLAIDAVEKANSGHPGTPMALAPAAYALWMNHMHYNPANPNWFNRDRFVLSNEAASMAGHFGLGKLIVLYDDNHITIEGNTSLTYSDEVGNRFESYHWHVQNIGDKGNDIQSISEAFTKAKAITDQPSLIILRTHIGYGSPNKQDTSEAHGSPLGASHQTGWTGLIAVLIQEKNKKFKMDN